ncbi:MAG: CopG family ribbon-helix-helix protein [Candidatus Bathyarchaeia archaeon]
MPIVSISINERLLSELEKLQDAMGYSGRSEAVRAGIRMLLQDARENEQLRGVLTGVLLVIHAHEAEDIVTDVKHRYTDVIHTQLHNKFQEGKCLELFILNGEAERIRELTRALKRNEENEYVKLVVI